MRQITSWLLVILFFSSTMLYSQQSSAGLTGHDLDQYKVGLMNQPVAERAPGTYTGNEIIPSDADFDLQFEFACGDASGEAGVETDGAYIYTTKWNGAGFFKYEINGTFLGAFQVGTVNGIRDLAYDGTYFYGGAAATTVYKMDFNTNTLIGQFTAPVAVRAIGYDEGEDGFWANNWSTTITLFDQTGAVLNTIPAVGDESFYGFAYDPQGPYLWGYSQRVGTSQNILYKYALPGGAFLMEFDVFPLLTLAVTGDIAGGLAFHPNLVSGFYSVVGIVQNKCIWGLEMGPTGPPAGTDVGVQMIVSPNSGVSLGTEQVTITIKNYGTNSVSNIPWTITWTGQGSGQYSGTYAGPLAGGAEATINPGTANLSAYGTYNFEACTNLAGDENPGNNCKTKAVVNAEPSLCVNNLYTTGCSVGDQLTSWSLENITIASIPCSGTPAWYQNYMDQIHELEADQTYVLTVTAGYANTYFDVWIDFDGNLELNNANELVLNDAVCLVANTVYTFDITIPADAPEGTWVMRARTNWSAIVTDPCATYSYGNCMDFKAQIGEGTVPAGPPPINLQANLAADDAVLLTWEPPLEPGDWLQWCAEENNDGIGLTEGGTFIVAARWVPGDLTAYNGQHLTKVAMFPRSDLGATFTLKIYTGANAGTMLVNMPLTGLTQDEWNEITLTTPVVVDASAELWVGYEVTHIIGDYPAGCDGGPAVPEKGDMISMDAGATWAPLSGFGLDYNWNIKAFVTEATDATVAQPIAQNATYNYNRSQLKAGNLKPALNTGMRAPDSYKVYRDGSVIASGLTGLSYLDSGLAQGTYNYTVTAVYAGGESLPAGPVSIYVPGVAFPGISFNPTSLVENHANPNTVTTQTLMVTNTGGAPLTFDIAVQRSSTAGQDVVLDPAYVAEKYAQRRASEGAVISAVHGVPGGVSPNMTDDEIIRYDDGTNADAIGLTSGGTFHVSAYWPASTMGQYSGMKLDAVEIFVYDAPTSMTLKIFGAGTPTTPGALLHSQPIAAVAQTWVMTDLTTQVDITGADIWIGYEVTHTGGTFCAGVDPGPAVAGFGDMISLAGGTYESMSISYGLNYNWNIAGYLVAGGPQLTNDVGVQTIISPNSGVSLGNESVVVKIKNYGTAAQSNIPWSVNWTGAGTGQLSGTYAGPLAAGAEVDITAGTANLTAFGTYNFEACTSLAGDENPANNCKTKAVVNAEPSLCVDNLYTSGCSFGDGLTSWSLENITVASIPCAGTPPWYQNYMDQIHSLEAGMTYVLTVTAGYADTYFDVWIDFDGNLELNNANELVLNDAMCLVAGTVYTFNITIPADAPNGTYVMRARTNWTAIVTGPCDTYSYGNCVDFKAAIGGSQPTNWLSAAPLTGTVPPGQALPVTVTFNSTGLANPSTHNGALVFTSNAPGSPHNVPATLNVGGAPPVPVMSLNPTSLTENHTTPPQITTKTVTVTNTGSGTLDWDLTINRSYTAKPNVVVDPEYVAAKLAEWKANGIVLDAAHGVPGGVSPNMTDDEIIRYDDGTNADAIGLTSGGTFHVSAYWPASTMGQYAGMKLNAVEIFVYDAPTSMTLKIFGAGTPTTPGALLHSQPIAAVAQTWVMTTLTTPVDITGQDIWIGYEVTHAAGTFCAGVDPGPAVAGFGDMISLAGGTYESMSISYGLNYNWNIAGYLIPGGSGGGLITETYEDYNAGTYLVQQAVAMGRDYWTTWSNTPGTAEDPFVSNAQAFAGSKSMVVEGTNDAVLLFGDKTEGNYDLTFNMYIPTGFLGYFNLLHAFAGASSEWGLQVYFDQNGAGLVDAAGAGAATFSFGYDTWIPLKVNVNLDEDWCMFYVNNNLVVEYQWSLGTFGTAGLNQLAAANFYAWNVGGTPKYYIDHIELAEAGAPVEEWLTAQPTSGSLGAGQSQDITVTFNSNSLEIPSIHNGALVFTSNAAGSPHTVPATLNVGGAPPVPVMSLNPTQLMETHLNPPEITTKEVLVTNTGGGTLNWDLTVQRSSTAGPDAVIDPEFVAQQYATRMGLDNSSIERAPGTYPGNEIIPSDADFDLQFEFACGDASGEAGIETDGNYIYTTKWNGAGFFKYEINGTFLGAFQVGTVNGIRDLAYDGTYFYGGAAATTVYKMDFNTNTLIGQFTAPVAVRAIGYDEGEDGFWANNWSTTITLFDQSGAVLNTIPAAGDESFYGFAYDPQGPYLWGYSQRVGTSQNILYKYALPGGAFLMEFDVFPLLSIPVTGDIAGGLAFHPNLVSGYYSIVGIVQNKCIWGLEMGTTGPPAGTDVGVQMIVSPNSGVSLGTEQVTITIKNYGTNSVSNIPWTITWTGQGSGQYSGTYAGPLAGGAEATINPGTANLSAYGTYNFEACTNLAGDENPNNNCKTKAVVNAEPSLCVDNLYTSGCSFGDGLTSWDLENITVASIPCAGTPPWYQNYMDQIHNLEAGNTYVLTVTAGYADTYFDVWIDFDGNLELNNANELILNDGICAVAGTVYTFNITIPADAPNGTYVLRARTNWTAAVVGACDTYSYGNCIDFKAAIGGGGPTDPWLSALPISGSLGAGQSQVVTVTFNSNGLEIPSVHNGSLIFTSNAAGSPHTVPATLIVDELIGPYLVLNPTSLTENHTTPPQQTTKIVNVSNPGTEALIFDIAIQRSSTAGPDVVVDPEFVAEQYAQRMVADGIVLGAAHGVPGGVSPNMTDDEIIRYDDGTNADAIGLTSGGTFHVSAYWPASTMGQYAGMKLDAVEIFVYDAPTSMTLNIYGAGTPTTPGALLHSQPIAAVAQTWVMTTLTSQVDITGADIWIGYEVTHTGGTFCAGVDPGPAVAGFGDMISLAGGTYESMSISYGLNYNWNIAGYLVAGGPQLTNDVGVQTIISPNSGVALGTESVVIKVKNFGTAAQSNIPWSVTWTGAGSGSLSGTIPGPLAGGADIDVTAGTANLAAFGTYNFEACTSLAGDENAANNCKTKAVVNAEPSLCVDNLYTSGCSFGDGLTSWNLENITVANIPCAGTPPWYQDYTNLLHDLAAGNTYVLTVTAGYADTYFDVWIDFDDNLELNNANELVLNDGLCAVAGTVYTFNITIPADAPNGEFVLRARTNWIDVVTGPCDTYSYGNCVDFKAEVGGGSPTVWLSTTTVSPVTVAPGQSVDVPVIFNSTGLNNGTYNGALIFTSNAPTSPNTLPVTLVVGGTQGGLVIDPTSIVTAHDPGVNTSDHILNATNTGTSPLTWQIVIDSDGSFGFKYSTEPKPQPPVSHPSAFERAPGTAFGTEVIQSDADFDLQFEFACGDASGEAGVETDGNFIYTTKWNGAGFFKYEINGTFLGAFQVGAVNGIRDLAYDGTYFYGGAAATTVFKMDFNTNTLISQWTAPVAVRAIGYDEGQDGFWANNWSTTLTLFDRSGAVLSTIPTVGDESFYGLAYDPQGPFLWGHSQRTGSSQNLLYKYNLSTGAKILEFDVFPLLTLAVTGDIAGGLAFHPDLVTGFYSVVGIVQNKCIWGLEMGITGTPADWITASPMSGTLAPNQTGQITVTLNSTGLSSGIYTGAVIFNTNSSVTPVVTVPVTLDVITGVEEFGGNASMLMYPNPAKDVLNIEATNIKQVMILNNLGQVVYDMPVNNDNVQINTSNFGTGVYIVRIQTADKSYTEKLIIQ